MSGYIGPSPVPQSIQRRQTFTATASQTTFGTSGYTDGDFIDVYLNGVKLVGGTDYTATNGSDIVLTTGAAAGDILDFVTFNSFQLNAPSFDDSLTLQNTTEEDTDGGRESTIIFKGEQSGGEISTLAEIEAAHDGTADDEKGDLIFRTNDGADGSAPTERLRIDSAGNVGIGTDTPSQPLHVSGSAPIIRLTDTDTGAYSEISASSSDGNLMFFADQGNTQGSSNIRFYVDGNHAGRFDPNGNLLVGKTSGTSGYFLQIGGSSSKGSIRFDNAYSSQTVCLVNNSSNTNFNFAVFENGGSAKGNILVTTTGTSYITSSDYRMKENVTDVTDGITRVKQLAPRRFNFIADPDTTVDGFIAHEAQTVVPEAVTGTHDGMRDEEYEVTPAVLDDDGNVVTEAVMGTRSVPDYQGIDQSKLVPLLTAALQEAIAKIETLETEMTSVKSRLDALENPA